MVTKNFTSYHILSSFSCCPQPSPSCLFCKCWFYIQCPMSSYICAEISYSEIFYGFSQSNQEDTDILGFLEHRMVSRFIVTILEGWNVSFFKVDLNLARFFEVYYFKTMPISQNWLVGWMMNSKTFGRKCHGLFWGIATAFAWMDWWKLWKSKVTMADVPAEIGARCWLNTSLDLSCYTSLFGKGPECHNKL